MGSFGPMEIGLIMLVLLLVFGAKRIPEIARGLGKGLREFKDATKDIQRELTVDANNQSASYRSQSSAQQGFKRQGIARNPESAPQAQAEQPPAQPAQAASPPDAAPAEEHSGPPPA